MPEKPKSGRLMGAYKRLFKDFYTELDEILKDCDSILDVGCGKDSPIQHLSRRVHCVGVDLFEPSIKKSKAKGIHDEYHLMDVMDIGRKFKQNSFDAVIALDLIEHLTKEQGLELMAMMERIAKKKVVIFTPNGFFHQDEFEENVHQEHKSGWSVEEMLKLGFTVIGIHGWKRVRSRVHETEGRMVKMVWGFLDLTQLYTRNHPKGAFQILCWKDKGPGAKKGQGRKKRPS